MPTAPEIAQVATSSRGGLQPRFAAVELRIGLRELQPERGRLGMDAMRAADRRRHLVLDSAALERGIELVDVGNQYVGGAHELHIEAGVEHVGRRHPGMHKARLGTDDLGEMREEGDDVVLDLALDGVDARHVEGRVPAFVPDFLGGRLRDDPELRHGVGGMRLDLEPDAEARLRLPQRSHLGTGVARDHRKPCGIMLTAAL